MDFLFVEQRSAMKSGSACGYCLRSEWRMDFGDNSVEGSPVVLAKQREEQSRRLRDLGAVDLVKRF